MPGNTVVRARIDEATKSEASAVLAAMKAARRGEVTKVGKSAELIADPRAKRG